MIVLEKWKSNKPISAIYFDGEKERYYVKRFLIETTDKEETFISDGEKAKGEIISTDYRPMAEVLFSKRSLDKIEVNFEDFISVKGIKAQGNQLTTDKIRTVNLLESLPYEEPEEEKVEEIEVNGEEEVVETSLPLDVEIVPQKEFATTKEDKAKKALERALQKKKAKEDDSQESLF
jgi:topoisomerase-4 subunit A